MVVVEVRQGTLGVGGRGWGPEKNTVDRGSQLNKDDEDDEDDKDDKDNKEDEEEEERRTRQEEAEEEEEQEEEEQEEEATNIKSNNPHLAGGENLKHNKPLLQVQHCERWDIALFYIVSSESYNTAIITKKCCVNTACRNLTIRHSFIQRWNMPSDQNKVKHQNYFIFFLLWEYFRQNYFEGG